MSPRRLYKSTTEKMLFGVAGGLGEYFNVDPVLVRIGFVFLGFMTAGCAVLLYLVLAIVMPRGGTSSTRTPDVTCDEPLGGGGEATEQSTRQSSVTQDVGRGGRPLVWALIVAGAAFFCASLVGSWWPTGLFSWWFNWRAFWAVLLLGLVVVAFLSLKKQKDWIVCLLMFTQDRHPRSASHWNLFPCNLKGVQGLSGD